MPSLVALPVAASVRKRLEQGKHGQSPNTARISASIRPSVLRATAVRADGRARIPINEFRTYVGCTRTSTAGTNKPQRPDLP
jgi:hypothetical protein